MGESRTDTTADEGEEERGVSRDLGRDLELKEPDGRAEEDDVGTDDEGLAVEEAMPLVSCVLPNDAPFDLNVLLPDATSRARTDGEKRTRTIRWLR